jgi:hypothetical protein
MEWENQLRRDWGNDLAHVVEGQQQRMAGLTSSRLSTLIHSWHWHQQIVFELPVS